MERTFGVTPREILAEMSGVDVLSAMIDGRLPAAPMARTMGIALVEAEEGRVVFEGAPTEDHLNPVGTTHGGWFGAILDSALGCAVLSRLPAGRSYTTLEYKVNLIRGIPVGSAMRAIGVTSHAGRSSAVATGDLVGVEDGRLYAQGSTTCLIMDAQA